MARASIICVTLAIVLLINISAGDAASRLARSAQFSKASASAQAQSSSKGFSSSKLQHPSLTVLQPQPPRASFQTHPFPPKVVGKPSGPVIGKPSFGVGVGAGSGSRAISISKTISISRGGSAQTSAGSSATGK